ncbi:Serine/threonine-protein kinase HT1 [Hordeum vulgare]|nr:Serine/threonine-protein kinase HT1 [Hordeum vulgare]
MAVEEPPSPAADSSAPRRQPEVARAGGARTSRADASRCETRYALDVNAERAEDVVTHQRLLEEARDPQRRPALSIPYDYLTPLQAAIGVVQKGIWPTIPKDTNPKLAELLQKCWHKDSTERPDFSQILDIL